MPGMLKRPQDLPVITGVLAQCLAHSRCLIIVCGIDAYSMGLFQSSKEIGALRSSEELGQILGCLFSGCDIGQVF